MGDQEIDVSRKKLTEVKAQPKSAHRYNVAEQQQIYKDEITSIWNRQRYSWTRLNITKLGYVYSDENTIVPETYNRYSDTAVSRCASAIDPSRVAPGTAMEVSQRLAPPQGSQITAHANFVMTNKKGLAIRRAVQSPYTGELMWRTEVIRDQANLAHNRSANEDEGDDLFDNGEDHMVDLPAETRLHLSDLKRALGTREADARNLVKSHMTTFSLPQPNKPKKEVIRCGNCGQLGHMKTNKKCPRYFEFNPV
ncbi:hypothetical protein GGH13_000826 [Coemansia sp. S155-1]|nr:hypothetical protein GGH13_000826 [Coemansia sp. S155-1]